MHLALLLFNIIILLLLQNTQSKLPKALAKHPQMGWNSWNHYHFDINQKIIQQTADAMVSKGLLDLGYNYVNIDDGWADFFRDENGYIIVNDKFPSGMKAMGDYIHDKGLKFGIYSDAGYFTCGFQAGSIYHQEKDVEKYTQWGVDYLKYDNCYHPLFMKSPERYQRMYEALEASERDFFFALCNWGNDDTTQWAPNMGHSWRTTSDISDSWSSMIYNLKTNQKVIGAQGPNIGWNDPDMLEIGNGGLNLTQQKTHFSLWAMIKAPLLLGCDITAINDEILNIIGNKEVIAVNQDQLGVQAKCQWNCDEWSGPQVWICPVQSDKGQSQAAYAIGFVNLGKQKITIPMLRWQQDLNLYESKWEVRDLWEKKDLGQFDDSYVNIDLEPYDIHMVKIQAK